ncbi:hypothetical protein Q4511_16145 [Paracoccus sp. 1_MG-2023]|uniref:hypothetical protein n=1 Tax=Paracoccus sp. 1_MG-2023 TaxID=3062651 RepID=UPI0026E29099|nr:hypothetical protein [Paracoccus sp. 1_MG-2023]MDO6670442.1 hypothetical protein [Paracoccus sp. 1_MG-2023]
MTREPCIPATGIAHDGAAIAASWEETVGEKARHSPFEYPRIMLKGRAEICALISS